MVIGDPKIVRETLVTLNNEITLNQVMEAKFICMIKRISLECAGIDVTLYKCLNER